MAIDRFDSFPKGVDGVLLRCAKPAGMTHAPAPLRIAQQGFDCFRQPGGIAGWNGDRLDAIARHTRNSGVKRRIDDRPTRRHRFQLSDAKGLGIVGVIQRFGSIFVNGERISYAPNVPVRIDGEPASAKALKIGHLARVLALPQADGSLITHSINVVSEVMGPIDSVKDGEITVLGQRIMAAGHESWRQPGANVAVFGVRRTDGVIVASLVEPRRDATTRVSGPLERDRDGLRIGGLRLNGVDAARVGQRVQAEGRVTQGVMQVSRARTDNLSEFFGASHVSIEGYVRRVGGNLKFGSGYVVHDGGRFESSGNSRVVVNAVFDGSRGLRVESIQSVNEPGGSPKVPGGGPNVPGGDPGVPGGAPDKPHGRPDAPRGLGQGMGGKPGGGLGGIGPRGGGPPGLGGGGFGGSKTSRGGGRH